MHPKEAFISHGILNPEIARMKDSASLSRRGNSSGKPGSGGSSGRRTSSSSSAKGVNGEDSAFVPGSGDGTTDAGSGGGAKGGLTFVYPYGATMTVQSPAHPVLSTGPISYPLNRPVAGVWERPAEPVPGSKGGGSGGGGGGGGGRAAGRWAGGGGRAARPEDHDGG